MNCFRVAWRSRNLTVARWATTWKMLPGPAGFAPASRRRPPTRSGPRRALGLCSDAALCSNAAELRDPVARGLAHARPKTAGRDYDSSLVLDLFPACDAILSAIPTTHRRRRYISGQGDGTRTRSQGFTTPCADPLTLPPNDTYGHAVGEIRTPDPLVRSEVLSIH